MVKEPNTVIVSRDPSKLHTFELYQFTPRERSSTETGSELPTNQPSDPHEFAEQGANRAS